MSNNEISRSEPQNIPAGSKQPQQQQRRGSFFEWAFGGSGAGASGGDNNSVNNHSSPPTSGFQPKRKPRAMSQTISHDEAMNLSRATSLNQGTLKEINNSNLQQQQQQQQQQQPLQQQQHQASQSVNAAPNPRRRKNSYEGMGLVAAYSGGPSSF